jgi:hypothetical protein
MVPGLDDAMTCILAWPVFLCQRMRANYGGKLGIFAVVCDMWFEIGDLWLVICG